MSLKIGLRVLLSVVIVGICVALGSGLVENVPDFVTIPENRYYGFPLVWRSADPFAGDKYFYFELFVDLVFWVMVILAVVLLIRTLMKRR